MNDRHPHPGRKVAVAQIGARRHYAVPRALNAHGCLARLYSDFYWPDRWANSLAARSFKRLSGRRADDLPSEKVTAFHGFYLRRLMQRQLAAFSGGREAELRQWLRQNQEFGRRVCAQGFMDDADGVYAFNGAALEIFECAGSRGLTTILDQTAPALGFEEAVIAEEGQRWPGWEKRRFESAGLRKILQASIERERAEWKCADRIICGSPFAAATVAEQVPADRVAVVNYPSPVSSGAENAMARPPRPHSGPLRVLFAGTLGLRKGLPWLFEAVADCNDAAELRLVGPSQLLPKKLSELTGLADLRGSVPRSEMRSHYEWADVLVLPTLSEGSANVCHEAMAAARTVIATPNAGSAVRDGIDGRLVPVRDSAAIAAALQDLIDTPALIEDRGAKALERSSEFTFDRYAASLLAVIFGAEDGSVTELRPGASALPVLPVLSH